MVHTLFAPILNTRNHALVWDLHMFVMFGTYTGVFFNGWDWLRSGLQVSLAVSDANMELPWDLLEESAGYLGKIAHVTARWGSKLGTWGKLYDLLIINHGNHGFPVDLTSGLIEIHFFSRDFTFPFSSGFNHGNHRIPLHESPNRQFLKVAAERGLRTARLATLQPDS